MNSKKRGQYHPAAQVWIPALCLVLVFLFSLQLFADIAGIRETTYFEKNFLVRDMSTRITALHASPGDIILPFDKDTFWFCYEFNEDEVATFDKTTTLETKTKYPIISGNLPINPKTVCPEFEEEVESKDNLKEKVQLTFANINDEIVIDREISKNINAMKCSNTEPIEGLPNKVILVDAGHGGNDDGATANNVKEKDITGTIGFSLYESLDNNKFFTRDNLGSSIDQQIRKAEYKSKEKTIEEVNKNNIDIIISTHIGSYNDNSNNIKAYYSIESNENIQKKSRKVACMVLNELSKKEELEISGISMVPIHPEDYKGGEILVKDKIAVLFEMGNIQNEKSVSVLTKAGNAHSITNSIIEGLKNAE